MNPDQYGHAWKDMQVRHKCIYCNCSDGSTAALRACPKSPKVPPEAKRRADAIRRVRAIMESEGLCYLDLK